MKVSRNWYDNFWVGYFFALLLVAFFSWMGWSSEKPHTWWGVLINAGLLTLVGVLAFRGAKKQRERDAKAVVNDGHDTGEIDQVVLGWKSGDGEGQAQDRG